MKRLNIVDEDTLDNMVSNERFVKKDKKQFKNKKHKDKKQRREKIKLKRGW